jgi:hypothetical protein
MYWTLRDSFDYWRSTTPADERTHPPDIVRAWERVRTKSDEFRQLRATHYLGDTSQEAVDSADEVFSVVGTHACQVGLSLLLATLAARASVLGPGIPELATAMTRALNVGLLSTTTAGDDRRVCLSPHVENPLNRIGDMNTPRAVEFRYLWLELLCLQEPLAGFINDVPSLSSDAIIELRDTARIRYTQQLIDERISERRRYDRSRSKADLLMPVTVDVCGALEAALLRWFEIPTDAFRRWVLTTDFTMADSGEDSEEEATDTELAD